MRILHLADVHLDRPFVGLSREAARQRRADLFDAFRRCLAAAAEQDVDAVTVGGDLWEDENVTPDTRASVAHELEALDVPILMVAGNHDPYLRGGAYERTNWPDNVTVVDSASPRELRLGSPVSVWGASWTERPLDARFLQGCGPSGDARTHLLLVHGTARSDRSPFAATHCPFDPGEAKRAGFRLVLAGHIHAASVENDVVYPGSPEPLDHSEVGRHCYALIDIEDGEVDITLVDVNHRRQLLVEVDCSDAASSAEVEARVREAIHLPEDSSVVVTVRLYGDTAPECTIDHSRLASRLEEDFVAAVVHDDTRPSVDVSALARRHTADGLFAAAMRDRIDQASDERERQVLEMALAAGVRAMSGEKDVLRVG